MNLGGLGAAPGGWLSAIEQGAEIDQRKLLNTLKQQQIKENQVTVDANRLRGDALTNLYADGTLPAPQPGQQSQPKQPQTAQGVPPQAQAPAGPSQQAIPTAIFQGAPMTGTPAQLSGGAPGAPPQGQPMPAGGPPAAGMPSGGGQPAPQPGGGQSAAAQPMQAQGGPLTLKQLLSSIKKANPKADPATVAVAVDGLLPLLKIEEQAAWHRQQTSEKALVREEKAREFDLKELRLRAEHADKTEIAQQKLLTANTAEEHKAARLELDVLNSQQRRELTLLKEDRLRTLGERRLDIAEDKVTQQREATASREKTSLAKIEATIRGQDVRAASSSERADVQREGIRTRAQTAAAQIESKESIEQRKIISREAIAGMNDETKNKALTMNDALKRDLAASAREGKFDVAKLNTESREFIADMNAEQKSLLAYYLESGREKRFDKKLTETRRRNEAVEKIQQERTEMLRERGAQQLKLSMERLGLGYTRVFGANAEQQAKALENAGVKADEIHEAANAYNMTNKAPSVTGFKGETKTAFERAYKTLADDILRAQGVKNPSEWRRTNEAFVKAGDATIKDYLGKGTNGDQVRYLSVAQSHINTLRDLLAEWQASGGNIAWLDVPALNRIKQYVSVQLGHPEATNIKLAAQILGTEIIKSLAVARAGTAQERLEMQGHFEAFASYEQMTGAMNTAEEHLGGQLDGMRLKFVKSLEAAFVPKDRAEKIFDSLLTPEARDRQMQDNRENRKWRKTYDKRSERNQPISMGTIVGGMIAGAKGAFGRDSKRPLWTWDPDDFRSPGTKDSDRLDKKPGYNEP